tara:strand:+ start:1842 stop:2555 length:714 start_codon:yes stop_codon:yes gene_type:complete
VDNSEQLPTVLSLCSGYGGIERGLELAGFEHRTIAYVEIEAFAIANLVAKMETGGGSWLPHLFGRTLKPCRWKSFETEFRLSLGDIPASHFLLPETEQEKMIPGTSGLTSGTSFKQSDLFESSLKTSKGISRLDCPAFSAIWKKMVLEQRGAYSARLKSAHLTREKESTSWPTPRASEYKDCGPVGSKSHTHMDKRSYLCAKVKEVEKPSGLLNPTWAEWLMGVPTGWTELGSWGTE